MFDCARLKLSFSLPLSPSASVYLDGWILYYNTLVAKLQICFCFGMTEQNFYLEIIIKKWKNSDLITQPNWTKPNQTKKKKFCLVIIPRWWLSCCFQCLMIIVFIIIVAVVIAIVIIIIVIVVLIVATDTTTTDIVAVLNYFLLFIV